MKWLTTMHSTNALVATVIALVVMTAIRALLFGKGLPEGWYGFVLGFAGIALVQFTAKRMTHKEPNGNGHGAPTVQP